MRFNALTNDAPSPRLRRDRRERSSIAQFDVPIGQIDKMPPALMLGCRKRDLNKWTPLGSLRFADKMHMRFLRQPVAFARIARDARANHIFPGRGSTPFPRHHMV